MSFGWLGFIFVTFCVANENRIPNVGHNFPVHIGAVGHIVQGRISGSALPEQLVPCSMVVEGEQDADITLHLRVKVRNSVYKRPYLYHPEIKVNTSDPGNTEVTHPVEPFLNSSLPYGMEFVVLKTRAFYVNQDRYVAVRDFSNLQGQTRIHFDVILKDTLGATQFVSNHLPFVVDIEYTRLGGNRNALLFAGVLVLIIVAISLVIPFVVRAKRRRKAGKPIFGCGSAEDVFDSDSVDAARSRASSISGKDNLAMIFENGVRRPSVTPRTTIQNRYLRSVSSISLQPHSLDPHYNEVYERPDFSQLQQQRPPKKIQDGGVDSSRGMTSNSSRNSLNAGDSCPINVNATSVSGRVENVYPVTGLTNGFRAKSDSQLGKVSASNTANGGASTCGKVQQSVYTNSPVAVWGEQHVAGCSPAVG